MRSGHFLGQCGYYHPSNRRCGFGHLHGVGRRGLLLQMLSALLEIRGKQVKGFAHKSENHG